jgi:hypothetical protein
MRGNRRATFHRLARSDGRRLCTHGSRDRVDPSALSLITTDSAGVISMNCAL